MITKAAEDLSKYRNGLYFTNSARTAWRIILEKIKAENDGLNILLPSYIGFTEREGSGIFDPVEETNADFQFYNLNPDLSVDEEDLERLISSGKYNVLLVVHYFGFNRNNLEKINRLCKSYDVVMVEDCAHAFQLHWTEENLGVIADYSFYSVHKHIPSNSGGILRANNNASFTISNKDEMNYNTASLLLGTDLLKIAEVKRYNYKLYETLLKDCSYVQVLFFLKSNDLPQSFPILINNGLREKLYFHLMDLNIPTTALYYRMIQPLEGMGFKVAEAYPQSILNLPVHQDIDEHDIKLIVKEIVDFLKNE